MPWEEDDAEGFRAPLPQEDRLWRHPAEVAAELRAHQPHETRNHERPPWRQSLAIALAGAAGGALIVTGLFMSLGAPTSRTTRPIVSSIAMNPVMPRTVTVDAADWPSIVAARSSQGIAKITVTRENRVHIGSGVLYRSDGMLLTSQQLVGDLDDEDTVSVTLADHTTHVGSVVGTDEISGLAVIDIQTDDVPLAPLGIFSNPAVGHYVVVLPGMGAADDLETATVIDRSVQVPIDPNLNLHGMIEVSGGPAPGSDGAAVLDTSGAVIGIVVDTGNENATFAVPIGYARRIAEDIEQSGTGRHSWMGIRGVDLAIGEQIDLGLVGGVEVTSVIDDGPAQAAGIRRGDVLTAVDGRTIASMTDLILTLRDHRPGAELRVQIRRDGDVIVADVVLKLRNANHSA